MKFVNLFLTFLLILSIGLFFNKEKLASYLLTQQLSSNREVQRILNDKNNQNNTPEAYFNNHSVSYAQQSHDLLSLINKVEKDALSPYSNVLGTSDRWIEIILSQQRLNAWEGSNLVYSYLVSTGLWGRTPVGDYKIWTKLAKTTMSGGSQALGTYYYLPNVPCTMYFYKGYGIHGTYWHNNFGHPMSHGCVNMKTDEACTLFNWASVGTRVNIHN